MSDEKNKGGLDDLPKCQARFKAKYLHALRRILESARERQFYDRGIGFFVEPTERGVFLIATDGWSLGVIHDPDGVANKPFWALLPANFCARAAPAAPLQVFSEGPEEVELPEWAQPGDVLIMPICAMITAQMLHPAEENPEYGYVLANVRIETGNCWREDDFRLKEDAKIPWRRQFAGPFGKHGSLCFNPQIPAVFGPLRELVAEDRSAGFSIELNENVQGPHLIRVNGVSEFVGAFMGQKFVEPDPLPEWLSWAPHGAKAEPASVHPFPGNNAGA